MQGQTGHERAHQFCRRFREELGYKYANAWPILGPGKRVMYHMIHATDHPEAPNLMARAYRTATGAVEPEEQFELELEAWRAMRAD